jgi:hypothetical protein
MSQIQVTSHGFKEQGMKSELFTRGKLVFGLAAMLFSSVAMAGTDPLDPTWVRPDTDFSKYTKFLVKPLNISDVKILRPPWAKDDPIEWKLETISLEAIQDIFLEAMKETLEADGGYPLVDQPGADVLEVDMELLSIMPYVRPGSDGTDDGHEVITLGSGEVTGAAELRDSTSRALLILLEGERVAGEEYKEFTTENNIYNLRAMFTAFAKRLRVAMDKVHGK